jgi:CheY-like chemotaxis protein
MYYAEGNHLSRHHSQAAVKSQKYQPTILVVEDSHDGREMLQILLGLKGYDVLLAADGREAIEVALAHEPDLILLDLEIPEMDGLSVARNLHSNSNFKRVPIIIMSGHDPARHRESAIDAGCSDYLLKPIDFARLDQILHTRVPLRHA